MPTAENMDDSAYPFSLGFVALDQASFEEYAQRVGVDIAPYTDTAHPMGILVNYSVQRIRLEDGLSPWILPKSVSRYCKGPS